MSVKPLLRGALRYEVRAPKGVVEIDVEVEGGSFKIISSRGGGVSYRRARWGGYGGE